MHLGKEGTFKPQPQLWVKQNRTAPPHRASSKNTTAEVQTHTAPGLARSSSQAMDLTAPAMHLPPPTHHFSSRVTKPRLGVQPHFPLSIWNTELVNTSALRARSGDRARLQLPGHWSHRWSLHHSSQHPPRCPPLPFLTTPNPNPQTTKELQ